jgi:uncharacterized membrane protein YhaH (DUF805 family)
MSQRVKPMSGFEFFFRIYLLVLKRYFKFSGRSGRSEFWGFVLASAIVSLVIFFAEKLAGLDHSMVGPYDLYVLLTLIPIISLWVRRLHDIGKSGWWYGIALIPLIGVIVLFIWAARDSERVPNRFGERPHSPYPTPTMFERFEIAAELLGFLWTQRLWWMIPLVLMMLILGGLIAFANATALGPFIYPLI